MKRLALCLVVLLSLGVGAQAEPKFLPVLKSYFNIPAGSEADKARCNVCHAGPPIRNSFGKAIEKALADANALDVTPEVLSKVEMLDTDSDGYKNGNELKAGFLPADPASHPATQVSPAATGPKKSGASASNSPEENPLIPNHTFHPALVHFPIALYLLGFLLEVVGIWKRDEKLRDAAFWNLLAAAASLAVVIPTGLIASFRLGLQLSLGKPVFTHFLVASSASIGIIASAIWQKRARPSGAGYWALLFITAALVSAAGYFGGELVY